MPSITGAAERPFFAFWHGFIFLFFSMLLVHVLFHGWEASLFQASVLTPLPFASLQLLLWQLIPACPNHE